MKEWLNKFNPFNSDKLLSQIYKWEQIRRGEEIPAPTLVSIDTINVCNLDCMWCNSDYMLKHNSNKMSKQTLESIANFLPEWGVKAVCVAGGGESLLNPHTGYFIDKCIKNGIDMGIVTNGINIDKHLESLANCTWVGVSVDSGSKMKYNVLKGKDEFNNVILNIKKLIKYSKKNNTKLSEQGQGPGVSYKYLLHPFNVYDVYNAAKISKEIGCKNLHIRPFGESWDKIGKVKKGFSAIDVEEFKNQLMKARTLEDETFKVFGITHKFDGNFNKKNNFKECYATFMTGVFMPPSGDGNFDYGLCCDRRGDDNLTLKNLTDCSQIKEFWGSKKHWEMSSKIKVNKCPRCTYQPHNQIFENVIKVNNMTYNFI